MTSTSCSWSGCPADRDVAAALAEVAQLKDALISRACIEQLKGMVMLVADCDAEAAWTLIVQESQRRQLKVRQLAAQACASWSGREAILASSLAVRKALDA